MNDFRQPLTPKLSLPESSGVIALTPRRPKTLWPAIVFLPVLLAGNFKSLGFTTVFQVDITLLSLMALFSVTGYYLLQRATLPLAELTPLLVFAAFAGLSLLWSQPSQIQSEKVTAFFFIALPCAFCVATLIRGQDGLRSFLSMWIVAGVVVSMLAIVLPPSEELYGRAGLGLATLGPAYLAASSALLALFAVSDGWIPRPVGTLAFAASAAALFAIGSRGPVLALAIGMAWWFICTRLRLLTKLSLLGVAAVATIGAYVSASVTSQERLGNLSDPTRDALREVAWNAWADRPVLGSGWGSFVSDANAAGLFRGVYTYPHNLFAESATELGAVGLLAMCAILVVACSHIIRFRAVREVRALGGLSIILIAGQQFSGDLTSRNLWMGIAACLVLPTILAPNGARGALSRALSTRRNRHFVPPVR